MERSQTRNMEEVYVNRKQAAFLAATQRFRDIIGGRGSGKTGLIAHHNTDKLCHLPGAKSGLAALTFNQLLNNTLPSMTNVWNHCQIYEHTADNPGHYVIGKRPPDNWGKPIAPPRSYKYIISFINGYHIQLISIDRPDTVRGLSLDALDVDEKAWVKKDIYSQVLFPLVRGNHYEFDQHPLHHSRCGYSSMPWLASGQWVLDAEERAKENPEKYFYIEATAEDNLDVLGPNYLEDARGEVPDIVFDVEYLNKRPKKVSNAFYPAFNEDKHCDFRTFDYDMNEAGLWVSKSNDVNPAKPLEISWDFNASMTSLIVCQENNAVLGQIEFRVCNELFVEEAESDLIDDLCEKFIETYADHQNKDVFVYGDRNGNNKRVDSAYTFYEQITEKLSKAGWSVYVMVQGLDAPHKDRYRLINKLLAEHESHTPRIRFNQNNCKYTIISMQNAPMKGDFQKDKSSERPGNDQKRATHLSDCVDNILFEKYSGLIEGEVEYYEVRVA